VVSVTADSNIWISAFNFAGKPRRLIEMADSGEIDLAISEAIITEVLHVLRDYFQWSDEGLMEAQYQMNTTARKVAPMETVDLIREDPADNRILECAAAARSDYIVSGDKDLLRVKSFRDMPIVKVASFLDLAAKHGRGR
jgi:putative PIN family toxin of toxin-antitoxin system